MTGPARRHDKRHQLASRHGHAPFSHVAEPPQGKHRSSRQGIALSLRRQPADDHSYHFISTFLVDHVAWHAERLRRR